MLSPRMDISRLLFGRAQYDFYQLREPYLYSSLPPSVHKLQDWRRTFKYLGWLLPFGPHTGKTIYWMLLRAMSSPLGWEWHMNWTSGFCLTSPLIQVGQWQEALYGKGLCWNCTHFLQPGSMQWTWVCFTIIQGLLWDTVEPAIAPLELHNARVTLLCYFSIYLL